MQNGLMRLLAAVTLGVVAGQASAMTITLVPDAGLAANAPALAAFQRSALDWSTRFADPINVTINAGLAGTFTNSSIIGSTGSALVGSDFNTIRNAVVADGVAASPILATLPTAATFSATLGGTRSLTGNLVLTTANAKALGFNVGSGSDATITFNSNFNFDYDSSNGVGAGLTDFQTVATHEIGHALGFTSTVDSIDTSGSTTGAYSPTVLDLFRFSGSSTVSATTFATGPRQLTPSAASVFSDSSVAYAESTGVTLGDGRQASHWKDDALTGLPYIGIMDPTLSSGIAESITAADVRAFDLIGYDLVPEPSLLGLASLGLLALGRRRTV